jgi:hypothetical protein
MTDTPTSPVRLQQEELPGVRRAWRELLDQVRAQKGRWVILEENVDKHRASSIRRSLARYEGIVVAQRTMGEGEKAITVYAKAVG